MLVVLAVIAIPGSALSRTWTVEKDGTGDFTIIQEAVDAAQPGDEIVVGPGRYLETTTRVVGSIHQEIHIWSTTDDLTIQGVDAGAVFIGPDAVPFDDNSVGAFGEGVSLTLKDLTIENVEDGVCATFELTLLGCRFRGCELGVDSVSQVSVLVEDSLFENCSSRGVLVRDQGPIPEVVIRSSEFRGCLEGVDLQTNNNLIEGSQFIDNVVGLQFSFNATGAIRSCYFSRNRNGAVAILDASQCELTDNTMEQNGIDLSVWGGSQVTGSRNLFGGGSFLTLEFRGQSTATLRESHILVGESGWRVRDYSGAGPGHEIDLRENYWGTDDPAEIAGSIWDHNLFPQITGTVLFEPFLGGPVPSAKTSFGGLKAQYGNQPH